MNNKILTVILSVFLAFTITFTSLNAYATSNLQIGDANGDGQIDLMDVTHLAQYVAGWDVELGTSNTPATPKPETLNFNNANEVNIYNSVPNGEVHILMWRAWHPSEQKMIEDYEEKTGVKIKTTVTTETEYSTKLVSMISEGNSPDIVKLSTDSLQLIIKALQPLDEAKFHLSADCWNKQYMDAYKVNNKYFGVSMPESWNCEDGAYVTYYAPKTLKNCGVTVTPYELYKQGKWNWDTQHDIAIKVRNKGLIGLSVQSCDTFSHSAGADIVSYNNSQFTNNLGSLTASDLLSQGWLHAVELKTNGALDGFNLTDFKKNQVGLFTAISYGLYNEGDWFNSSFAQTLEIVPIAGPKNGTAYTPITPKVWSTPKYAKNPKGAAYFLRYFLDVSNYNHSETFHTAQFKEVYERITAPSAKKSVMYGKGIADYIIYNNYNSFSNLIMSASIDNVVTALNSQKNTIYTAVNRVNKDFQNIQ